MARRTLPYVLPATLFVVPLSGGAFAALETDTVTPFGEGVCGPRVPAAVRHRGRAREDEVPLERRESGFEREALRELRALHEGPDRLDERDGEQS